MTNVIEMPMTHVFFDAANHEIGEANRKEEAISAFRAEQNVEPNKLFAIAHLSVVAKSLRLDEKSFTGRKAVAPSFKKMIMDMGIKEAKAKLLSENAQKFARHAEFGNAVEAAARHGNVGNFAQEVGATFDALEITTQSRLVALLNPKEERTPEQALAIAALKAAGAEAKNIKVTAKKVTTNSVADDVAVQMLVDAAGLMLDKKQAKKLRELADSFLVEALDEAA